MNTNRIYFIIKILAALGISLAIYLLWEQHTQPINPPCSINATVNCDAIISGAVAKTFGIPTPIYGLIGYITIFLSAFLKKRKVMMGMATFGLAFCLWIAYRELFQLHVVCPVCICCQLIMITTFCLSIILNKKTKEV